MVWKKQGEPAILSTELSKSVTEITFTNVTAGLLYFENRQAI